MKKITLKQLREVQDAQRLTKGEPYGQFLGVIGLKIAQNKLPSDILERLEQAEVPK